MEVKEAGLEVPMFDSSTLSAMARSIERGNHPTRGRPVETIDWDRDAVVPTSLLSLPAPETWKSAGTSGHIVVLTGATGQLGGSLLKTMIEDANAAHVRCIGVRNLADRQQEIGFDSKEKVTLHEGDLYQRRLGLSGDDAGRIFGEATIIIHSSPTSHTRSHSIRFVPPVCRRRRSLQ